MDGAILPVCDQPGVNAGKTRTLIRLNKGIAASSYANTLGVPALFSRRYFHELLSLEDDAGAKSIILRNRERVAAFPFPDGSVDIDIWSDYERLTNGA